MAQVNVEFDDDTVRHLDRIAAKQSVRRPELLRRTVRELIEADASGREPFTVVTQAFKAEELAHLAREHRQLATELDRVMRANAKREGELLKAITAFKTDAAAARERGSRDVADALERALGPFRAEVVALKAENATLTASFEAALADQPRLDAIDRRLAKVEELTKQPRTATHIHFGELTGTTLGFLGLGALGIGLIAWMLIAMIVPSSWMATPAASWLLGGGDQGVCKLIDYRYGYTACRTRVNGHDVSVTVDVPSTPTSEPSSRPRSR